MTVNTYVGVGRDAYEFKTPVRFRLTFTEIGGWSCSTEPGPNVQNAGDSETSNEDALILGEILHARYQAHSQSAPKTVQSPPRRSGQASNPFH